MLEHEIASIHMQRIVGDLELLKKREEELRLEYTAWSAISQPNEYNWEDYWNMLDDMAITAGRAEPGAPE